MCFQLISCFEKKNPGFKQRGEGCDYKQHCDDFELNCLYTCL